MAGARRRIYLHIGEPKTGTTFLQRALWNNRGWLAARGVTLPGYKRQDHSRASRDLRGTPRAAGDPADPWTGEWDVLAGQALHAPETAIISDEVLVACNPPQADRAVRSLLSAEVHIVLTVRDLGTLLPAEWQETVKCRGTVPWDEWLSDVIDVQSVAGNRRWWPFWMVHDTLATLDMWSQHVPPDQVHVITVPQQGAPDALWVRFASVLGIEPGGADLTRAHVNLSLGLPEAEFMRRMNEALPEEMPYWFYTRNIKRVLAHEVLDARPRPVRLSLPPDREAWARQQAEILIAGLRDSKFHIVGDLGELLPPATGPYLGQADQPAEQLLDTAVAAAAALAHHDYLEKYRVRLHPSRWGSPRHMASRLKWAMLNGRRVKRVLRKASYVPAVRRLRIVIWRVLIRPARRRALSADRYLGRARGVVCAGYDRAVDTATWPLRRSAMGNTLREEPHGNRGERARPG